MYLYFFQVFLPTYFTILSAPHHDGIVYHHSDGDGERRKRDDVDRVTGNSEIDKRCDQRERNGYGDDQRRAPAS